MSHKIIDLNSFAEGAMAERFDVELQKILENIADPNTDAKKVRKLTLTISLKADDKRDVVLTNVIAKSTLAPAKEIEAKLLMDLDGRGKVTGAELKSGVRGQTYITEEGDVADDRGQKIINLKQQSK
ncbi:replication terminator protein [Metabacillus idriensis]|uniref:replication terminator protein n=1 Tax=Metabacillus idriensis TaxID=324768 RepID=UPI00203B851A|nr:replication terminator protein [Metabacillus idriensis]MCM3598679.1 replication terminator protein [Metabacillus idriensis]